MIRPIREEDLERVAAIGNAAWRGIYAMYRACYGDELFNTLMPDSGQAKGAQIRNHYAKSPQWFFVCEEGGKIVGFVTFWLDEERKIAEIGNNAVDPACGLKGIGQQMYAAVMAYCREKGMAYIRVTTGLDEAHGPARRAYERAGFDISSQDVTYYKKL